MSLPNTPTLELTPGAVLRRRHIDHIKRFLGYARDGQRGTRKWPFGVQLGRSDDVAISSDGTFATFVNAVFSKWHVPIQKIYEKDRIVGWAISAQRQGPNPIRCELRRFKRHGGAGYETPALAVLDHFTQSTTQRELIACLHDPIKIEPGYCYRIVVIAGNDGDLVYGGYVENDHPEI